MLLAAFSNIINIGRPIPNSDLTVKKFQSKKYPILLTRMSVFIIIHWGRLINNANDIHICRNSLIAELSQNNVRQFKNNTIQAQKSKLFTNWFQKREGRGGSTPENIH